MTQTHVTRTKCICISTSRHTQEANAHIHACDVCRGSFIHLLQLQKTVVTSSAGTSTGVPRMISYIRRLFRGADRFEIRPAQDWDWVLRWGRVGKGGERPWECRASCF
ncbi:hypothetical protein AB1N83_014251 [Pleurotus pulmonarius]